MLKNKAYNSVSRSRDSLTPTIGDDHSSKSSYFQKALGNKITHRLSKYKRTYSSKNSLRSDSEKSETGTFSEKIAEKGKNWQTKYSLQLRGAKCVTPNNSRPTNQNLDVEDTQEVSSFKPKKMPYVNSKKPKKLHKIYANKFVALPKNGTKREHKKKS